MSMNTRSYSELCHYSSFEDRFEYLVLHGQVGRETYGFDRWINQKFYRSAEWKSVRSFVIVRDEGCDLGVPGYSITGLVVVHHINPMVSNDIVHGESWILNPDFLITTSHDTHNAIHYGDRSKLRQPYVSRSPGDTKLW